MATVEIDIDSLLSDDDKREIAADEFRTAVRAQIASHARFNNAGSGVEAFLSNIGYETYWHMLDEIVDGEGETAREIIRANVLGHIRKRTTYGIFRDRDLMGRQDSSPATKIANEVVAAKKHLIENRVEQLLNEMPMDEIRSVVHRIIDGVLRDGKSVEEELYD